MTLNGFINLGFALAFAYFLYHEQWGLVFALALVSIIHTIVYIDGVK